MAAGRGLLDVCRVAAVGRDAVAHRLAVDEDAQILAAVVEVAGGVDQLALEVGGPSRVEGEGTWT
jgi:hypothetical protein